MALKLIRTQSGLEVDGTNARMKRLMEKIKQADDRKVLNVLNRAWWVEFFRQRSTLRKAA